MRDQAQKAGSGNKLWFWITMLYIVIDYGRPQDILPIGFLRLGMISNLVLAAFFLTSGRIKSSDSKQTRLICYFVLLTAAFIPFARNNFLAYNTTWQMLLYMPFVISTIIVVDTVARLRTLLSVMILLMTYVSIFSLLEHGQGSGNYFKDENDLCLYINCYLPFCCVAFLSETKRTKKIVFGGSIIAGIFAIVVSFSRGGLVGLVCMVVAAWWFAPKKIVLLLIISLVATGIYFYAGQQYMEEMSTITDTNENTATERIESWKAAWRMFVANPFGVGGNNFQVRFPEYQTSYFQRGMWGRVSHSLWFTLLPELGIIGVFIYLCILCYNIRDVLEVRSIMTRTLNNSSQQYFYYMSIAFLASFAGFFGSSTFLSVLYYPHYWYITAILVATRRVAQ